LDKKLTLKFLDQTGFSLMLSLCYTWFKRGSGQQFKIPTRWRSEGRINLIGTLSLHGEAQTLEVRELEGSCTRDQVVTYLESLLVRCRSDRITVVVLDNAAFHKGGVIAERQEAWAGQGLFLRYLPAYCPSLNLIEGVWRVLKGFLMPRRCYGSVVELREALLMALSSLGTAMI
jgi:putative transposase